MNQGWLGYAIGTWLITPMNQGWLGYTIGTCCKMSLPGFYRSLGLCEYWMAQYITKQKHIYPIFGFSIFLCERPSSVEPTGWQQNDCYYIYKYIWRNSRLREYWKAQYIANQKNKYTLFLDSLSFCVKNLPLYLQQGGHKMAVIYSYLYMVNLTQPKLTQPS